jgi:putative protease
MPRLHPRTGKLLPEVLSPVGAPDCLPAAVAGGADAVFLGLRHFNARGRAENFRKADLPAYVRYLHRHDVKCYLVMNTLVHDDEFPKALDLAATAADAGVDAAIIQDLGLWRLLTREVPGLKRHASTQMTIHHPSQVEVLAQLGAERVILARELALAEVAACTREAARLGVETEHFVHGALCYAFSGQCLMSNFAGCRSANRGTCAQNCRFDYQRGGETVTEISMKDLALVGKIPELAAAGVASLKIEGRLKGADYVYTTARIYRAAVDAWAAGTTLDLAWAKDLQRDVFSRANTSAPLDGIYDERSRLHRWAPDQDAVVDAELLTLDRGRGEAVLKAKGLRRDQPIRAGQGFAFTLTKDGGAEGDYNGGFLVIGADRQGDGTFRCKIRIAPHGPKVPTGTPLFRNTDHSRKQEAAAAMAGVPLPATGIETTGLRLTVRGAPGEVLSVSAHADDGRQATVATSEPLALATGKPLDAAQLGDKLGSFGGTAWHLIGLENAISGAVFCPASVLKDLRRQLVEQLAALPVPAPAEPAWQPPTPGQPRRRTTQLWVAVGSLPAARAALAAGADQVWLDDPTLDLWRSKPPVLDLTGITPGSLWLRHPATAPLSPHLAHLGLPVVAGHLGVLAAAHAAGLPAIADLFCNTYSTETLAALGERGAQAAVLSLELSSREVARLAARCGSLETPALALVAAGRLPAMLTRQDHGLAHGEIGVIQAVPKDGGLAYELQRRRHDTVIWEGRRLSCPEQVSQTAQLVDAWVLEFADLAPTALAAAIVRYAALRDGALSPDEVAELDRSEAPRGTFTGHLHQGSRELDLVADKL